jgi:hypothetical protein
VIGGVHHSPVKIWAGGLGCRRGAPPPKSEDPGRQPRVFWSSESLRRTRRSSRPRLHVQKSAAWSVLSPSEYRLAICERCRIQLRICGRCDRGQRLCDECRPARRRESVRRAGAAYRVKARARRLQSVRQARYRDRLRDKFADQKVTHHLVTEVPSPSTSSLAPEITAGKEDDDDTSIPDVGRCSLCRAPLPLWARRRGQAGWRNVRRRAPRVPRGPPR